MESGELAEFDDADEPTFPDFLEWYGLYKVWLRREQQYQLTSHHSFRERAKRGTRTAFRRILDKAGTEAPRAGDELPV
jgi:hypothetical protein